MMAIPQRLQSLLNAPVVRRVLPWVGYPLFYVFALVVFSYFTAPYDRLKTALTSGFNSGDAPLRLHIDELTWSWRFPGIAGSGGRLVARPGPEEKAPREYTIDDFYVRMSVFPLLWGTTSASFGIDAFGGSVTGSVSDGSDAFSVSAKVSDVEAGELPYLVDVVGLPMFGKVVGGVDLTLVEGQLSKAEGELTLDIEDLAVGDGQAKIRGTIALPRLEAGLFTLAARIEAGRVTIEEFSSKGPDLELVAEGKIRLLDKLEASLVEMDLRFRFSDGYKRKSDMTRALFGEPGSNVPGVFDLDPKIKQAKRDDGFYVWRVTGPLNRMNFQPGTSASGGDKKAAAARRPAKVKTLAPKKRATPVAEPAAPAPVLPETPRGEPPSPPPVFEPPPPPLMPPAMPLQPPPGPPEPEDDEDEEEAEEGEDEEEVAEEG
jgi:type II secretion system protein N